MTNFIKEVEKALQKLKYKKIPHMDGVGAEHFKNITRISRNNPQN